MFADRCRHLFWPHDACVRLRFTNWCVNRKACACVWVCSLFVCMCVECACEGIYYVYKRKRLRFGKRANSERDLNNWTGLTDSLAWSLDWYMAYGNFTCVQRDGDFSSDRWCDCCHSSFVRVVSLNLCDRYDTPGPPAIHAMFGQIITLNMIPKWIGLRLGLTYWRDGWRIEKSIQ